MVLFTNESSQLLTENNKETREKEERTGVKIQFYVFTRKKTRLVFDNNAFITYLLRASFSRQITKLIKRYQTVHDKQTINLNNFFPLSDLIPGWRS
jgi:hypothetical protein